MYCHFIFGDIEKATSYAIKCPIYILTFLYAFAEFSLWSSLVFAGELSC